MNDKLIIYNSIVNTLQRNDHNGTYDEILQDYDNNINEAIKCLYNVLERIINDEGLEGDELLFYKIQLARVKEFLV